MLESEETKLNICESSAGCRAHCADPGQRCHRDVGLCGSGKEHLLLNSIVFVVFGIFVVFCF